MAKQDSLSLEGTVVEVLKGARFKVQIDNTDKIVNCTLSGKMRQNLIRILKGDYVEIEVSPYDLSKGRITWRDK